MKKFQIAAAAAVMATASVALYSASPALAQKMDADGDKTVTWAEAKTKADAMWVKLDLNKDGKLDTADRDAKMGMMFDKIDTDKNGSVSRAEFMAHHSAMKGRGMGADKMAAGAEDKREGWKGRGKGRMGHHGMMGGAMQMAKMADTNKDGAVSRAEFDAGVKMHFDMADANKDGKITPEERRAAMKAMRDKMGMGKMGGHGPMGDGPPPPPPAN
jgi:Ca2+-binding EF-hand superfamily protein